MFGLSRKSFKKMQLVATDIRWLPYWPNLDLIWFEAQRLAVDILANPFKSLPQENNGTVVKKLLNKLICALSYYIFEKIAAAASSINSDLHHSPVLQSRLPLPSH